MTKLNKLEIIKERIEIEIYLNKTKLKNDEYIQGMNQGYKNTLDIIKKYGENKLK